MLRTSVDDVVSLEPDREATDDSTEDSKVGILVMELHIDHRPLSTATACINRRL